MVYKEKGSKTVSGNNSINAGLSKYSDFTLPLALFDAVPVILFLISGMVIYRHFGSALFLISVIAMFAGGSSKVLWKIIIAAKKKDVTPLTAAFRILMFGGFGLMIVSVLMKTGQGALTGMIRGFTSIPSLFFFIAGIAGMCVMGYLGSHMDESAKSNWIEETVNAVSQAAFLTGLLLL